ncbi:MAG: hypothetical protein RRA94_06870 [Bacteroidota bacterium]|nr:hypothetical protein [Bacteroidota bacterium]
MPENERTHAGLLRTLRPTLLLALLLLCVAAGMFTWTSVLTSVRYDAEITPPQLYAVDGEEAVLRLRGVNRLGGTVPFSEEPCLVEITDGAALVTLEADADSIRWTLRAQGAAGTVSLRVFSRAWPFPVFAFLRITSPMARLSTTARSMH